jgi:hypothetical protein
MFSQKNTKNNATQQIHLQQRHNDSELSQTRREGQNSPVAIPYDVLFQNQESFLNSVSFT